MITVVEAFDILNNVSIRKNEIVLPLHLSNNYILAEEVRSPINMPPFRQSAMDGFAIQINNDNSYLIIGEIKAGAFADIIALKNDPTKDIQQLQHIEWVMKDGKVYKH